MQMRALVRPFNRSLLVLGTSLAILPGLQLAPFVSADAAHLAMASQAISEQSIHPDSLMLDILNSSGVLEQFNSVAETVVEESRRHWANCRDYPIEFESWILDTLSPQRMKAQALRHFPRLIQPTDLDGISAWLNSDVGKAIVKAEQGPSELTELEFRQVLDAQHALPDFQRRRAPKLQALVDSTGAATIVTILNTELNALVQLASECSPDQNSVLQMLDAANADRDNMGLVTFMMRLKLREPATVIYRDASDTELDAYLKFSNSPTGKAYHAAIVSLVRDTMIDSLQAMARRRM